MRPVGGAAMAGDPLNVLWDRPHSERMGEGAESGPEIEDYGKEEPFQSHGLEKDGRAMRGFLSTIGLLGSREGLGLGLKLAVL